MTSLALIALLLAQDAKDLDKGQVRHRRVARQGGR